MVACYASAVGWTKTICTVNTVRRTGNLGPEKTYSGINVMESFDVGHHFPILYNGELFMHSPRKTYDQVWSSLKSHHPKFITMNVLRRICTLLMRQTATTLLLLMIKQSGAHMEN